MTIKDLAAMTGYAVGTVSRVLNNHPSVSEKARQAILKAVEESGFELNANAKQLKQQHANTVLVVVKGMGNELFAEMLEHIQAKISNTSHPLVVDYIDEGADEVRRAIRLCKEKKPRGIVFLGGDSENFRNQFAQLEIPCVLITNDASSLPFDNLSSVSTDDREAARRGAEALIALGHRKIAVLGGYLGMSDISQLRLQGCRQTFEAHGLDFELERDYRTVRFSCQEGYRATMELLEQGNNYTAIFAAADVVAIGAIRALGDKGLRVPEDVSVMGVDGLPMGDFLIPRLATVSQNVRAMADRGTEILLDMIENGSPRRHETIPFRVEEKESIGKI